MTSGTDHASRAAATLSMGEAGMLGGGDALAEREDALSPCPQATSTSANDIAHRAHTRVMYTYSVVAHHSKGHFHVARALPCRSRCCIEHGALDHGAVDRGKVQEAGDRASVDQMGFFGPTCKTHRDDGQVVATGSALPFVTRRRREQVVITDHHIRSRDARRIHPFTQPDHRFAFDAGASHDRTDVLTQKNVP